MSAPIEDLIVRYALNTLSPRELKKFEKYCQTHPEVMQQVRGLREVMGSISLSTSQQKTPVELKQKIEQAMSSPSPLPVNLVPHRSLKWWDRIQWRRLAAGIVGCILLGLAIDNYLLRSRLEHLEHQTFLNVEGLEEGELRIYPLKSNRTKQIMGSVLLDLDESSATIALSESPILPSGQFYHLWATVDSPGERIRQRQYISCGQFNSSIGGKVIDKIRIPIAAYSQPPQKMFVTIESVVSPQHPSSTVVIASES
jgi:hypothetical protein